MPAEAKGFFILMAVRLMTVYKESLKEADDFLFKKAGIHIGEVDPEKWYDTIIFKHFMGKYVGASPSKENAWLTLGKTIYPTIKRTIGLPENIKTPVDLIEYDNEAFLQTHRGEGIRGRKIVKRENNMVIVQAPTPGYNAKLVEGVYLGILSILGIKNGSVKLLKGEPEYEYEVRW